MKLVGVFDGLLFTECKKSSSNNFIERKKLGKIGILIVHQYQIKRVFNDISVDWDLGESIPYRLKSMRAKLCCAVLVDRTVDCIKLQMLS